MKHTPGPWIHDEHGILMAGKIQIASILPQNRDSNARLIAAAPDMLEALKELTRVITTLGDVNEINAALNKALDAINKANGK